MESLIPLLEDLKSDGAIGHTSDIVIDPDYPDSKRIHGFDGDGPHQIGEIKL